MKQCEYSKCGKMFEPKKPKARFCSDKCRVYWNRVKEGGKKAVKVQDANNPTTTVRDLTESRLKSNYTIDTTQKEMPTRQPGEDAIDFAIRKNEWKLKHNQ